MSDLNLEDDILTLTTPDGEEVEFVEVAAIPLDSAFYAILQPLEPVEGIAEDEALVFEVSKSVDGEDNFTLIDDDKVIDAVFAEYNRLLETQNAD